MKFSAKVISFLMIICFAYLITASSAGAANTRFFTLNQVKGQVFVIEKPGAAKKAAVSGMRVGALAEITTGANGFVKLMTDDGGAVNLAPQTKLVIKELKQDKGGKGKVTVLKNWTGKVFLRTKKMVDKNSRFQIETPTAVAGVRGTIWEVHYNGKETKVGVFQGAVGLNNQTTLTGLQQATSVNPQAPAQVEKITPAELNAWEGEQLAVAVKEVAQEINSQVRNQGKNLSESELHQLQKEIDELKSLQQMVEEVYELLGLPAPAPLNFPADVTEILLSGPNNVDNSLGPLF